MRDTNMILEALVRAVDRLTLATLVEAAAVADSGGDPAVSNSVASSAETIGQAIRMDT